MERSEAKRLQAIATELRDRLAFTELRLKDSRSHIAELEEHLENSRRELANRDQHGPLHEQQIKSLQDTIHRLEFETREMINRSFHEQAVKEESAADRDSMIKSQALKLASVATDMRAYQERAESDAATIQDLQERLQAAQVTVDDISAQTEQLRQQAANSEQARHEAIAWRADAERYKSDVARLLRMLGSTSEWAEFAQMAVDSGGVTFVGNPAQEAERWVPEDAYALASAFHRENVPTVPFALFADLLAKLNKIWQQTEATKMQGIRGKFEGAIKDLKRQLEQRNPYKQVVQAGEIDWLRRRLKHANSPVKVKNVTSQLSTITSNAADGLLASSLSTVQRLSGQVNTLARENAELREQLQLQQSVPEQPRSDGFADGVLWMGRTSASLADALGDKIQSLSQLLMQAGNAAALPQPAMELNGAFADKLTQVLRRYRDRVRGLFQQAVEEAELRNPQRADT
eukprot:TRINITY_DN6619_c0_g2_i1.p1 TRINITY_DN6619_c0_g2~~TRINITY_DN6619_c0_g2_i1.p1  ORF type:complete len:473 (+),score=116.31 TRINITY_DN6619_c0_g2_i1:39-1421(+)